MNNTLFNSLPNSGFSPSPNNAGNPHAQFNGTANNSPFPQGSNFSLDPSLTFNNTGANNSIDYNQQNPQLLQQRLNDGSLRHPSPGFQHPSYNVNPVVPAKRSRPGDENIGASPRPAPGHMSASRSQTPQQPGVPNAVAGQHSSQAPNPYQGLQQQPTSNHASPSPRPQFQQSFPQNNTSQPDPSQQYPTQATSFGGYPNLQNRPGPNQHQSNQQVMRGMPGQSNAGALPGAPPGAFSGVPGPSTSSANMGVQEAQRQYQLQLQQQQQQRLQSGSMGMQNRMPNQATGQGPNMGTPLMNGQAPEGQTQPGRSPEVSFNKSLMGYLQQRGQQLEQNPSVCGRPVNYYQLFVSLSRLGIIVSGPNSNNWQLLAQQMGFPPTQYPSAPEELRGVFRRSLMGFAQTWSQMVRKKQQQNQQNQQNRAVPAGAMLNRQPHMSPQEQSQQLQRGSQPPGPGSGQSLQQQSQPQSVSSQQGTPGPAQSPPSQANGLLTPQKQQSPPSLDRPGLQTHQKTGSLTQLGKMSPQSLIQQQQTPPRRSLERVDDLPTHPTPDIKAQPTETSNKTNHYEPIKRTFSSSSPQAWYGGLPIGVVADLGERLAAIKPGVPTFEEMGNIDVHALTMSIQSGIRGEVRYAVDQLVGLTSDTRASIVLSECDDLVETLLTCGEEQLEILSDDSQEKTSSVQIPFVEDLSTRGKVELTSLQDVPAFATADFEANHASEVLVAITTILRNLSIPDSAANHEALARSSSVQFIASIVTAIRQKSKVLRSARNTHDLMKDIVTLLSNISHRLSIPDKDSALSLLCFLLAFAPGPAPDSRLDSSSERLFFQTYNPKIHQYLPTAIDAFAKLLARDEPNRSYFKSIFDSESPASNHQLLTQAFGLAIAPIPDQHSFMSSDPSVLVGIAHKRNPYLSQAMIAANILASLAPGSQDHLARSWLESEDGWAPSLMRLVVQLSSEPGNVSTQRHPSGRMVSSQDSIYGIITQQGLSTLKRLTERCDKRANAHKSEKQELGLDGVVPKREMIANLLCQAGFDQGSLKNIITFASTDS